MTLDALRPLSQGGGGKRALAAALVAPKIFSEVF